MVFVGISMTKRTLYILVLFLFCVGCKSKKEEVAVKQKSVLETVLEQKVLKVIILNNSISYFLYKGTPMGFHYELVKEYAKALGVELKLKVAPDYDTALEMLERKQGDILASSVSITGSRKKKMLFTIPLMQSNPVLVQNKNSTKQYVEDWLTVDSMQLSIISKPLNRHLVKNIEESLGLHFSITSYTDVDQEQMIEWVAEDSISATLADKVVAEVAKTYHSELDISIAAGLSHNIAWAVNLEANDLQEDLNKWLLAYKESREFRLLNIKYFQNKKSLLRNRVGNEMTSVQISPYDTYIKEEAKKMGWDWRLLAALIYTESRFDPSQISWAGAFGLMQLMPRTAKKFGATRYSSEKQQIEAGRKYIQYLEEQFAKDMIDREDLSYFVLAAYNSGMGHIRDARNLAEKFGKDRDCWEDVENYVLLLSSPKYYNDDVVKYGYFRGKETANHVRRIRNLYKNYQSLFAEE